MFKDIAEFYDALAESKRIGGEAMRAKWEQVPGVTYPKKTRKVVVEEEEEEEWEKEAPEGYISAWDAMRMLECSGRVLESYVADGFVRRATVKNGRSKVFYYCQEDVKVVKERRSRWILG